LEIKPRAQRGMTFLILTYIFVMAAKKPNIFGETKGSKFCQKYKIQIFVKNATLNTFFKLILKVIQICSSKLNRIYSNILNVFYY